jgi:predicted dehydrogenase
VVVAGPNLDRAHSFATTHGIPHATSDWAAAVALPDVDAVVIGTPNAWHHRQTMAAIAAGKHVLVEKPIAMNMSEAREMADAARGAGLTLLVGHMWRYRDEVVDVRTRILSGAIGTPVRTRGYGIHAGWGPSGWFTDPALSGGGALIDMGIHAIDTARFLLGDPLPAKVCGSFSTAFGEYAVEDDAVVLIDWSNGVRSVIEAGWWQPRLDGLEADTEVFGTAGVTRIWPSPSSSPPADDYVHCSLPMYRAQMADFAACCATGRTPVASADVGLVALSIVEDVYRQ